MRSSKGLEFPGPQANQERSTTRNCFTVILLYPPLVQSHVLPVTFTLNWNVTGNGIDCYRHYEALMAGAIPIIWRSSLVIDPMLGHCGNILFVERGNFSFIEDLSPQLYHRIKEESRQKGKFDCRKLVLAQYWFDRFERDRADFFNGR